MARSKKQKVEQDEGSFSSADNSSVYEIEEAEEKYDGELSEQLMLARVHDLAVQ